jgi:hypothetical protein
LELLRDEGGSEDAESLQVKTSLGSYDILRGVCQFAHTHDEWNVYYAENSPAAFERYIQQARPDGIVAGITTLEFRQILERSGAKVVNYGNDGRSRLSIRLRGQRGDRAPGGKASARTRHKRAVYVGYPGFPYSDLRFQGFIEQFETRGQTPQAYPPPSVQSGRPFHLVSRTRNSANGCARLKSRWESTAASTVPHSTLPPPPERWEFEFRRHRAGGHR